MNWSITEIFNDMTFEEKNSRSFDIKNKYYDTIKKIGYNDAIRIIDEAIEAQYKWKTLSSSKRANILYTIGKTLPRDPDFGGDYFIYYSDLISTLQSNIKEAGITLIILNEEYPFFILGAIVSAALAAGCAVIIQVIDQQPIEFAEILKNVGLPKYVFNIISTSLDNKLLSSHKIRKIVFYGSNLAAKYIYNETLFASFMFLCPNNTSCILLESCDINAAIDKILCETWGLNSCFFKVSTVVVQESIYDTFVKKLEFRLQQFTYDRNNPKFKDKKIHNCIDALIEKAAKSGAIIITSPTCENEWGPTIILQYQNQDIEPWVPVIKVMVCRTAKEGVSLLNNCRFSLATSIWTEISSQALEIASMLFCNNIWINCHGCYKADVEFQATGNSGNFIIGGQEAIVQFYNEQQQTEFIQAIRINENINDVEKKNSSELSVNKNISSTVLSAHSAFKNWYNTKDKKFYLTNIVNAFENQQDLASLCKNIYVSNQILSPMGTYDNLQIDKFYTIKVKVPIGVIIMFVATAKYNLKHIIYILSYTIMYGNAIILVIKKNDYAIENFQKYLPKSLLHIFVEDEFDYSLVADPFVQAVWFYGSEISSSLYKVKKQLISTLKSYWIVNDDMVDKDIFISRESLRNKSIWLPKVDQFLE